MTAEKMSFQTEVNQLLHLMIHSLYSHKEVSIRELISNASDAIDKARFESLTRPEIAAQAGDWKIRITADREAGTLTISDNGIGMTRQEAVSSLGTIARSGTREFLEALKQKEIKDSPELIGQFGVGFYSSFMIADKVTLISSKAGSEDGTGVRWESSADGTFTVEDAARDKAGTDVILHIKQDEKQYLDEWHLREVVRKYSDYVEYPIVMEVEREEESSLEKGRKIKTRKDDQLNTGKAIWLRDRSDIREEEYHEFYKHLSHDFSNPLHVMHYRAEGTSEFTCLLYIPERAPLDIFYKEFRTGPALYVKKVQIMDHCEELLPPYLRFVKGVIDSSDLPLNVSREILQNNRQITVIKNNITKKVLDTLAEISRNDPAKYLTFHKEFGRVLKEGLHYDFSRKEAIADLLLFASTRAEQDRMRTLADYIQDMKEDQKEIYFMTGAALRDMQTSPYLEVFRDKGIEVLLMLDEIDDMIFSGFEYKGKKFKSVLKGDISLDRNKEKKEAEGEFSGLISFLKEKLKDDVKDVRLSGRLRDSACCLVGSEGDIDPRMEKFLKSMGQDMPDQKKVLEINPGHALVETMNSIFRTDGPAPVLGEYALLLLDQALLLSGARPKDPALFAKHMSGLMLEAADRFKYGEKGK